MYVRPGNSLKWFVFWAFLLTWPFASDGFALAFLFQVRVTRFAFGEDTIKVGLDIKNVFTHGDFLEDFNNNKPVV